MASKSPSSARKRFAQRLRAVRIPRGYRTARSFATALEIDENRYTRYERAEVEPDLDLLMRMCDLLGVTPNDLLCDVIGEPYRETSLGFAERSVEPFTSQPAPANAASATGDIRKAIAWQLAEVVAEANQANSVVTGDNGSRRMQHIRETARQFARIDADPFSCLAELANELASQELSDDLEARFISLSDDLIRSIRAQASKTDQ